MGRKALRPELQDWSGDDRDVLPCRAPGEEHRGQDRAYQSTNGQACCTGVLEATVNSNVIGVAHIGWISRDPEPSTLLKGRHAEYGRSVDDMTGVFAIEKFIQLWGNSTCGKTSVDWLPCV